MRTFLFWVAALMVLPSFAAERTFKFGDFPLDQTPPGFRSLVAGRGTPGDWKVIADDSSTASDSQSTNNPATKKPIVLAQLSRSALDDHFPILLYDEETFSDVTLKTRFKVVGGGLEQMAGIVFRFQNESNFYVVRASVLGKNIRCYKVSNGKLLPPFGPELEVSKGDWHDLIVQSEGNRILCILDGKEVIKLVDNLSASNIGKIGFWTKSDSVSYFGNTTITYTPREVLAQTLVRDALKEYPRLMGLAIFTSGTNGRPSSIIASKEASEVGKAGGKTEEDVIAQGNSYFGRNKGSVTVTIPLRDRNGEPIAAVRVILKSFPGQTEENAVARALPVVTDMQARVQSLEQLIQ